MALLFCWSLLGHPSASVAKPSGSIAGWIRDTATDRPLSGVNVYLVGTARGVASDSAGHFCVSQVPVGLYNLRFSRVGYTPLVKTQVLVKPGRTCVVHARLQALPAELDAVVVRPDYFARDPQSAASTVRLEAQELHRIPGAMGDVFRATMSAPGVSSVEDQINDLVVRGGDPVGNLVLWEDIELAHSSHFAPLGRTGGLVSLIDMRLVEEAEICGASFPGQYGECLSAVVDLRLRKPNPTNLTGSLDLGIPNVGCVIEGPIGSRCAAMLSYRAGYLDLIKKRITLAAAPRYQDVQGKVEYQLNSNQELALAGIGGRARIEIKDPADRSTGRDYVNLETDQYTTGLNWKALWTDRVRSLVTASYGRRDFHATVKDTVDGDLLHKDDSWETTTGLKGQLHFVPDASKWLTLGGSVKQIKFRHKTWIKATTYYDTDLNQVSIFPELDRNVRDHARRWAVFAQFTWQPDRALSLKPGVRYDYCDYTAQGNLDYRFGVNYQWTHNTSLSLSTGSFHQTPALTQLTLDPQNRELKSIFARHYVVGLEHLFGESLKSTLEFYQKEYRYWPVSRDDSTRVLVSKASGDARGLDLSLHKKLTGRVHAVLKYSLSRTRFKEPDKPEYDSVYDSRHVTDLTVGYRPSERWEISARWRFASGRPYTPVLRREPVGDDEWDAVYDDVHPNSERYPDYHRLDVRWCWRKSFERWNLVTFLEVENLYDRENVWQYVWSRKHGEHDTLRQFALHPLGALSIEF